MPTKKEVILKFSDPTYVPTDAEFGEWKFAREKLGEVNNFTIDKATEIAGETVKQVASELKDGVTSTARLLSEGEYGKMLVSAAEGMVRGTVDLNILGRKIYDTIASFGDDESAAFQRDREIRKMVRARESAKKGETSLLASAASSGSQARKINSMVDPKMSEGAGYVLDPFMLTPLGVGGKMGKVAGKAAGGVAKAVGAAARLPEKAVGMVESGIARTAQRFLGDGSEEVTRRARTYADLIGLGGVAAAAGLPAAGTVAAARLGVKGLDEAGKGAQAVGRAAAEGPSRFGLFERMSVDPELSQFSRRLAGVASSMGGDTAARAAKAGAVGAVEGASVGAVLGGLADGAEGAIGGAAAGTMLGSLGGVTGLGVDHVTGKGEKRATANDIQRFAATLPEDQARAFKNLPYNAQGDIALAKGVIGDSVSFQVLRPKEFQQQVTEGGASAAHRVLPGTGESVIFIKESPNLSRADVLHEIGHAIYTQTPDIKTSVLQTIQGIYSPDEIRNIEMDYVSRLRSPDAVKRGKAFTDEEKAAMVAEIKGTKGEDYFINEIFAETFADTSISHSLNRLRKGKLTPVVQEKLLDAKAAVFQKLGIKVKEDGSIDRAALMPWVKSSPRFQKLITGYTKDLFTFRQNINKRPDPETVKLKYQLTDDELKNPDIGWKWNEERSQYEHPLGTLIPGPGGKEDLRNGTVIRKTQKEIRAEDRARADEVNQVIDRETPRGADDPMLGRRRQIDGKEIISGKILPEGIYQVSSYNDSQKETMRTVQDSLESNDGTVFQIHYQPIGTSKGQGYKQSVRGTLGSMEMKVREIIPFEFKVTKKDGLNIQALDFTEVKERIKIWKKQGLLDRIYNGNVQAFQKDLSQYLSNLKERVPGETGIGQNKRDFMQAFLGGTKGVNPARGEVPASSRRSLIRSFRVDRTNTLKPAFGKNLVTGEFGPLKYGFDYYRMRDNLSPERKQVESDVQQFSEDLEDINIKNSIYYDGENIVVSKFIVPDGERNKGIGTEKMRDLQRLASMHNAKIALTPSKDFGATSIVRLRNFYKQLGFKENKGSNKDWSTKESMIWSPDTFSMDSEYVKAVQSGDLIPLSKRFNTDSEDIRFSPERVDERHRQAFESGDYEKAKQLLEAQAAKNGYVGPWYHGGAFGSQGETVPWIPSEGMFLARNKSTAESYSRNRKLNELYFKQDNVFDPTNSSHLDQEWVQDWINFWREDEGWVDRKTGETLSDSEVKDLISRTELYEYESNGSGERWKDFLSTLRDHHDGFIGYDPTDSSWISVVFDPSQLKSADPFTFDGNGNLIPLSKRFNTDSEDIRFSPERDALKSMEPGDASKPMNTSALNFFYNNKNPALAKPQVETSNSEAASLLQDEAVKFWGEVVTSKDIEPWQKDILVETVVDEVKAALKADGKNAANWYTTDITAAIDIAKKLFSELENDAAAQATPAGFKNKEDAALGLFVATAITSQNLKVSQNTRYAVEQFDKLIKTGKFDSERSYGSKAKSINENLSLANKMVEDLGWSGLKKFISTEFTIKKLQDTMLNDHGLKVSIDGNVADIVNGAAIFGPKIGQGFLQNLLGSFNPVTIDLWMRRTWGRWTGNVVNKQIKQEQIAGLISEMKKGRRRIPDALKKIKIKTDYRPSTGKEFITIPDRQYDAIQNSPEMVEAILKISKEIDREWQQVYTSLNRGIAPEDTARLLAGDVTPYKMAEKYNKIREKLKEKHKKLKASDPGIDPFSKWVDKVGMPSMGYTDKYEQWGKGTNVKPQFVRNAEAIVKTQKPIDAPSNADRKVITEVINNARGKLEDEGYTTTNADIQAILWYPEKDIWDQLTGRKPNKLKSSYNDEFRKIAEQRGISYSPHREPARAGWGSGSGQTGRFPDQVNAGSRGGKSFSPERYFSLRSGHRIIHPPGRKVRLYAPSGALVGVYESEEQAMRRASR